MAACRYCRKKMNPVESMLGGVCGSCVRKQHKLAVQGKPGLKPKPAPKRKGKR